MGIKLHFYPQLFQALVNLIFSSYMYSLNFNVDFFTSNTCTDSSKNLVIEKLIKSKCRRSPRKHFNHKSTACHIYHIKTKIFNQNNQKLQ